MGRCVHARVRVRARTQCACVRACVCLRVGALRVCARARVAAGSPVHVTVDVRVPASCMHALARVCSCLCVHMAGAHDRVGVSDMVASGRIGARYLVL